MSRPDRLPGSRIRFSFATRDDTGLVAPVGLAVAVFKDASTSPISAGVTLTPNYGGAGVHLVDVNAAADGAAYSAGSDFFVRVTAGTAGGQPIVGYPVGEFSLGFTAEMLAELRTVLGLTIADAVTAIEGTQLTPAQVEAAVGAALATYNAATGADVSAGAAAMIAALATQIVQARVVDIKGFDLSAGPPFVIAP